MALRSLRTPEIPPRLHTRTMANIVLPHAARLPCTKTAPIPPPLAAAELLHASASAPAAACADDTDAGSPFPSGQPVSEKVDVYSFGMIMWSLWCQLEPFEGFDKQVLLRQLLGGGAAGAQAVAAGDSEGSRRQSGGGGGGGAAVQPQGTRPPVPGEACLV